MSNDFRSMAVSPISAGFLEDAPQKLCFLAEAHFPLVSKMGAQSHLKTLWDRANKKGHSEPLEFMVIQ